MGSLKWPMLMTHTRTQMTAMTCGGQRGGVSCGAQGAEVPGGGQRPLKGKSQTPQASA